MINTKILKECGLKESDIIFFKNNKLKIEKQGNIKIMHFKNPKNYKFYLRYIFDGYRIIVSGDLGVASYNFYNDMDIYFFEDCYYDYFNSKCECSSTRLMKSVNIAQRVHLLGLKLILEELKKDCNKNIKKYLEDNKND